MKNGLGTIAIVFLACACMLIRHLCTFRNLPVTPVVKIEQHHDERLEDLAVVMSRVENMVKSLQQDNEEIKEYILEHNRGDRDSREEEENGNNNDSSSASKKRPRNRKINELMLREGIVIEEYKLMFMPVAKVGSSLVKRLMMRMNNNPYWCEDSGIKTKSGIHDHSINKFVNLGSLPTDKRQDIMRSKNWTRAIFLREPKERILSAFQDKAFHKNGMYMKRECCPKTPNATECKQNIQDFAYFLDIAPKYCQHDLHWLPLHKYVDEHWWPFMDFVGYSDTLAEDFETLLKSLHSAADGVSAWERFGEKGWDFSDGSCNETSNVAFGRQIHHTKANGTSTSSVEKLKQFYTPELEKVVENLYQKDWESPYYHFPPIKIF